MNQELILKKELNILMTEKTYNQIILFKQTEKPNKTLSVIIEDACKLYLQDYGWNNQEES